MLRLLLFGDLADDQGGRVSFGVGTIVRALRWPKGKTVPCFLTAIRTRDIAGSACTELEYGIQAMLQTFPLMRSNVIENHRPYQRSRGAPPDSSIYKDDLAGAIQRHDHVGGVMNQGMPVFERFL